MHLGAHSTRSLLAWRLILLAVLTSLCGAARAQGREDVPRVTLHAKKIPFLVALRRICDQSHTHYQFEPDAASLLVNTFMGDSLDTVSFDFIDMPVDHAISYVLRHTYLIDRLTFREDQNKNAFNGNRVYVFSLGNGVADRKTTVHLVNVSLLDALRGLCDQLGANYAFNLGRFERQTVTVSLDNTPVRDCVQAILQAAHAVPELTFEAHNGVAIVGYKQNPVAGVVRRNPIEDTIYLKCTQQNAYYAAFAIALSASGDFVLPEDLKSREVSLTLSGVPIRLAVQSLGTCLKTPLVSGFDAGVVIIALKHAKNYGHIQGTPRL